MTSAPGPEVVYRFGLFTLDVANRTLTRRGLRVRLQEQPFHFLELLLEKQGAVVSRDEIRDRLWPGNTFVDFDKSLGVAVLKVREALEDDASNPRFVETVPRRGYRFIAPIAVEAPVITGKNTESALAQPVHDPGFVTDAAPIATSAGPHATNVSVFTGGKGRLAGTAAAISLLGVLTFGLFRANSNRPHPSPLRTQVESASVPIRPRRSVAVLGFRGHPPLAQNEWLSTALSEMLNTELASGGKLRLVSGEDVARMKREISLTPETTLSNATLHQLQTNLGADVVLLGSYTMLPSGTKKKIRLDVRLQDTALGGTIAERAFVGNEDDLDSLVSRAGVRLREDLSPGSSLAPDQDAPRPSPSNRLALQLYSEGLSRLYAFDFIGSRDSLQRAVAADPNYPLSHAALAQTLGHLGYRKEARVEAKLALDQSHSLSQEDALAIKGQYEETMQDWPAAVNTYQLLFSLFPDNIDYGLRLASVQRWTDQVAALTTLTTLRKHPAMHGEDPRIDLMEASALVNHDLTKGRSAAQRAISIGTARGETLTIARGYGILCQQGAYAGVNADQAITECNTARASYVMAGDKNNAARTLIDLGAIYYQQGAVDRAVAIWRAALNDLRTVGDAEGIGAAANNLGDSLFTQGDLKGARTILQEALTTEHSIDDADGVARVLSDLGNISFEQADLRGAQVLYQKSTAVASSIHDTSAAAFGMEGMGDVLVQQADFAAARSFYRQALQMRTEVGEKEPIAQTSIKLERLMIEEGHTRDAEEGLRRLQQQSSLEHQDDDALSAGLMLTRALLADSKVSEAATEMTALRPLADATQNRLLALRFAYALAVLQSADSDLLRSQSAMAQVLVAARTHEFFLFSDEVSIVIAEVTARASGSSTSRAKLGALQSSLRSKGLLLLARESSSKP
jgi:DNA-binding winged helix-turn-helix (wHTH) protein/tetratricopeptide (TPR) repeat protein